MVELIQACICGSELFDQSERFSIPLNICVACGIPHQRVDMSLQEYEDYYKNGYHKTVYTHSYEQDKAVANLRLEAYTHRVGDRLLDVGCGNGAFVDAAAAKGIDACGQDLVNAANNNRTYVGPLKSINFPTEDFSAVTIHDVLEHVPDIRSFVNEVARIVKQHGRVFIEFPDFYSSAGTHHWKKIEHLWYLKLDQVKNLFARIGFSIEGVTHPIPGKFVICFVKNPVTRARVLVPPGIGDIYWCMTKMQAFCADKKIKMPDVVISSTRADRNRSVDYVRRLPFVHCCGYHEHSIRGSDIWRKAYMEDGESLFKDVEGCEWFISLNGASRFGRKIEDILPQYKTDWYLPMFISLREHEYGVTAVKAFDPYIVAFFTDHGTYEKWLAEMSAEEIYKMLRIIHKKTGKSIILTGADWDKNQVNWDILELGHGQHWLHNLIGHTTLEEFFGLLRYSSGCIGFCGGNTIMSAVLKKPTVIIWNDYYNRAFWDNACPTDSLGNWYHPVSTGQHSAEEMAMTLKRAMAWKSRS